MLSSVNQNLPFFFLIKDRTKSVMGSIVRCITIEMFVFPGDCRRPCHPCELQHVQVPFEAVNHRTLYLNAFSSH